MGTVIDITNRIKNQPAFIKLGDKTYEVKKDKNTVISCIGQIDSGDELNAIDICVEMLLGKKAKKEIDDMKLDFADYKVIFTALMAAAMDVSYEKAEAQFRDGSGQQ